MKQYNFTLIELLIVVGILGALIALIIPSFFGAEDEAKKNVVNSQMRSIQNAFIKFSSDVNFTCENDTEATKSNKKLLDITQYGLWPLLIENHPVLTDSTLQYNSYDIDTQLGRRAPYMQYNVLVPISTSSNGQEYDEVSKNKIPVIKDPYGGYYRVIFPEKRVAGNSYNEYERLQRMVLVCTGPNKILDTKTDSFIPIADAHATNIDDIIAQEDDTIIRLMPLVGF